MLEHVFGHGLDIYTGGVVPHPEMVSQDGQFQERRVPVELQPDAFLNRLETLEEAYALVDLFAKALDGDPAHQTVLKIPGSSLSGLVKSYQPSRAFFGLLWRKDGARTPLISRL